VEKSGDVFANIIISDASFRLSFHREMNAEDSFQNSPIWGLIYTPKNLTIGATSVSWKDRMEEGLDISKSTLKMGKSNQRL
jgi:hypothetical protein